MASIDEREGVFLREECRRLGEKIRAANGRGRVGKVLKRGEELNVEDSQTI